MATVAATEPRGGDLAEAFAEMARTLLSAPSVQETLQRIVDLAVETVDGCDHAGVSLVKDGCITTRAASDDVPSRVDRLQYEANEGPCVDAIEQHEVFRVADVSNEAARWPRFAPRVTAETGVRSMLAYRLFVEEQTLGALNLYSEAAEAFDEAAEQVGTVFAAHAAVALASAQREEHLETAIESRDVIGQAKGVLMARQNVSSEEAFEILRRASQRLNVKLRDVAGRVVEGQAPEGSNP